MAAAMDSATAPAIPTHPTRALPPVSVLTGAATLQRMVLGRDSVDLEIGDHTRRVRLCPDPGSLLVSV